MMPAYLLGVSAAMMTGSAFNLGIVMEKVAAKRLLGAAIGMVYDVLNDRAR